MPHVFSLDQENDVFGDVFRMIPDAFQGPQNEGGVSGVPDVARILQDVGRQPAKRGAEFAVEFRIPFGDLDGQIHVQPRQGVQRVGVALIPSAEGS